MSDEKLKGDALSRAVAEMLVNMGKLKHKTMQEGYYDAQTFLPNPLDTWITLLDGDELWGELHADYATNPAHALTLLVDGWQLSLFQGAPSWLAVYKKETIKGKAFDGFGATFAEAICLAWLEVAKYLESEKEQ